MNVQDVKYQSKKLKNGLTILTAPLKESPTVTSSIFFKVGSRNEEKKNWGISHFLEHIVFKGNKKFDNYNKVSSFIEGLGGTYNAFTSKEHTAFYAKVAANYLKDSLKWLGPLATAPIIDQKDVQNEKGVILEEINMYNDNPMHMVDEVFEGLLFDPNPLGRRILGKPKTLKNTNSEDLKNYHSKFYKPQNAVFVIAGNLDELGKNPLIQIEKEIDKNFSFKKSGQKINKVKDKYIQKEKLRIMHKKTDQTHLYLGAKTFSALNKKNYPLSLLSGIIGGGGSSWAYEEIREKRGLAYYVKSSHSFFNDTGYYAISAGLNNDKLDLAIKEIVKLFQRAQNKLVTPAEIKRVKNKIMGKLILERETSDDIAFLLGKEMSVRNKIIPFSKKIKILKDITREDLRKIAREVLKPQNLRLALIGPWKKADGERFKKYIS